MKALILAAGLGSRLRPLTDRLPKPLCLFYGQALLDLVYKQIRSLELKHIAINTHHLAPLIEQHIQAQKSVYTCMPRLSYEPEILGTGGVINPLRSWLGEDPLLIYNSDIIADVDLPALIEQHKAHGADATMVLLDRHKPGTTPIRTQDHSILAIGDQSIQEQSDFSEFTFSGIHIIGPRLYQSIPMTGFQNIIASYQSLLTAGAKVQAFFHSGFWEDLGTPHDYFAAHQTLFIHPDRQALCLRIGLDPTSIFWDDAQSSALCGFTNWGKASLSQSFIMGPSSGAVTIQNSLVYPGVEFLSDQVISQSLVMPGLIMSLTHGEN